MLNDIRKFVRREWEQVTCGAVLLALAMFCLVWYFESNRDRAPEARRKPPRLASLLAPDALDFLHSPLPPDADGGPGPFDFETELPGRRPPRPVNPPAVEPQPEPEPEPVMEPEPEPEPEPGDPRPTVQAPRFGYMMVKYLYASANVSGKSMAIVQVYNPVTRQTEPHTLGIGQALYGMKVYSVTPDALTVLDARGNRKRIGFGESTKILGLR